jgi:hypothetical protein
MYGNVSVDGGSDAPDLSAADRKRLRRDLASVAARTRELLPAEFVVGSEISRGTDGPQAMVAVQPPIGSMVSAGYAPGEDAGVAIDDQERDDIATGLAASAALQVKQAYPDDQPRTAR